VRILGLGRAYGERLRRDDEIAAVGASPFAARRSAISRFTISIVSAFSLAEAPGTQAAVASQTAIAKLSVNIGTNQRG
jgi:hypothetical protein